MSFKTWNEKTNLQLYYFCFLGCPVICVNLAERAGREKIISDAYLVTIQLNVEKYLAYY